MTIACEKGRMPGCEPRVSIVVPVYNTAAYLDACLEALVTQSLSEIEVIVVDDGSTDKATVEKCDEWGARDERIRVFHLENGGLSAARNRGARLASAEFIGFVDSDDIVHHEMFEVLLDIAESSGAQLACCDVLDLHEGDRAAFSDVVKPHPCEVLTVEEAIKGMVCSKLPRIWVPTHLYARSIFEKGFEFPLGKTYEDAHCIFETFENVSRVALTSEKLYGYFHHGGTITTSGYSAKTHDIIDAWDHCMEVSLDKYPSLCDDLRFRCFWARAVVLDRMTIAGSMEGSDVERELVGYLKGEFKHVKSHVCMTRSRKVLSQVLSVSLSVYRLIVRRMAKRRSC